MTRDSETLAELHRMVDGPIGQAQRDVAMAGGHFRLMLQVFASSSREAAVAFHEAWVLNKEGKHQKADEMIALAEAWDRRACRARETLVTMYDGKAAAAGACGDRGATGAPKA